MTSPLLLSKRLRLLVDEGSERLRQLLWKRPEVLSRVPRRTCWLNRSTAGELLVWKMAKASEAGELPLLLPWKEKLFEQQLHWEAFLCFQ